MEPLKALVEPPGAFVEPPAAFVEPPGAFVEPLCGKHVPQSRFHDARVHFFRVRLDRNK